MIHILVVRTVMATRQIFRRGSLELCEAVRPAVALRVAESLIGVVHEDLPSLSEYSFGLAVLESLRKLAYCRPFRMARWLLLFVQPLR